MSTEPIETNPTLVARLGGPTVRKLGWNPALDGARGVSVVLVMSFHFLVQLGNYLDGTPILVDMFFILSGFLITTLLFEERAKKGSISLRNFYLRRVFRLFPAVYALLAVFLVFALVFGGEDRGRFARRVLRRGVLRLQHLHRMGRRRGTGARPALDAVARGAVLLPLADPADRCAEGLQAPAHAGTRRAP